MMTELITLPLAHASMGGGKWGGVGMEWRGNRDLGELHRYTIICFPKSDRNAVHTNILAN